MPRHKVLVNIYHYWPNWGNGEPTEIIAQNYSDAAEWGIQNIGTSNQEYKCRKVGQTYITTGYTMPDGLGEFRGVLYSSSEAAEKVCQKEAKDFLNRTCPPLPKNKEDKWWEKLFVRCFWTVLGIGMLGAFAYVIWCFIQIEV